MIDDILVEPHDGWRTLTLNRPTRLNAVNAAMLPRLLDRDRRSRGRHIVPRG